MTEYLMDIDNLNVSHLDWYGLIVLNPARLDGVTTFPAQDNLFLTRRLATAEKQRRFPRSLVSDICWLLKEGREKGLSADLPGKLQSQNDLFRLQHALHAVKLTSWVCMVRMERQCIPLCCCCGRAGAGKQPEGLMYRSTTCSRADSAPGDAGAGMVTDVTGYSEPPRRLRAGGR